MGQAKGRLREARRVGTAWPRQPILGGAASTENERWERVPGSIQKGMEACLLEFAQCCGHWTARGSNRRGHSAEDPHDQSEDNAHPKKVKSDLEGEG